MRYVTDDYLHDFLRDLQPKYKGDVGELQKTATELGYPVIPHETARFLSVILSMKNPVDVLEIGAAVGFSASLMSQYASGTITTVDRFPHMIERFKQNIDKMNLNDKIKLIEGDALDVLPTLTGKYDVIFLDAAKGQYINFLPHCVRLLNDDGLLIADDVLHGGDVAKDIKETVKRDKTIYRRLKSFLWTVTHTDIFETSIIPIGNGVALCKKIKDGDILIKEFGE